MLSIGIFELMVIALVTIVFVGPERLPKVMREMGRQYGKLRRAADELRRAFVLEADRQDAEVRYSKLQERRKKAAGIRRKAQNEAGDGTVAQDDSPVAPDDSPVAPDDSPVASDDGPPPAEEEADVDDVEEVPEAAAGGE